MFESTLLKGLKDWAWLDLSRLDLLVKPSSSSISSSNSISSFWAWDLTQVLVRYEFNCENYHQAHKQVKI